MGMSQEVVDNLLTNSEKVPKHGSGVGLINVHTRNTTDVWQRIWIKILQ